MPVHKYFSLQHDMPWNLFRIAMLPLTWGRNRSGADLVSIFCLTANQNIYTPLLYMRVLPNLGNLTSRRLDTIHKKSDTSDFHTRDLPERTTSC